MKALRQLTLALFEGAGKARTWRIGVDIHELAV
jgi:hypothetical protein